MKKGLSILILALLAGNFFSCKDKCNETRVVEKQVPITYPLSDFRDKLKVLEAWDISEPGKMVVKGKYLFINEVSEGIHIIDNSDPANPKSLSFLQIPGNGDMAIFENILYVDSYCDVVALDISNINGITESSRIKQIFLSGNFNKVFWSVLSDELFFEEYRTEYVTEMVDCENPVVSNKSSSLREGTSIIDLPRIISRLRIDGSDLYAVDSYDKLRRYSLSTPTLPSLLFALLTFVKESPLFSFFINQKVLFTPWFGNLSLYNLSNPMDMPKLSVLENRAGCDKIVFKDQVAYIISQGKGYCGYSPSKLDLFDISYTDSLTLIKSYPLSGPKNLAIDYPYLYICEGIDGFSIYNITDKLNLDKNVLTNNTTLAANDVILSGKIVIVNADDGIYQFDGTDPKNLKQLSKIPLKKAV